MIDIVAGMGREGKHSTARSVDGGWKGDDRPAGHGSIEGRGGATIGDSWLPAGILGSQERSDFATVQTSSSTQELGMNVLSTRPRRRTPSSIRASGMAE